MSEPVQLRQVILVGVVCVLVGLLIGTRWPSRHVASEPAETALTPSERLASSQQQARDEEKAREEDARRYAQHNREAPDQQQLQSLQDQIEDLTHEKQQVEKQLADFLNWLLVNYRGKYPLPEDYVSKLRMSPVAEDMTLNPEVADLLKITSHESTLINDAFESTDVFLREMQTALMTVDEERPDKVLVHVPAFGEEGDLVREDLLLALEATLGEARFDRFMDVAEAEMESTFLRFGERARTIIFEVVYTDEDEASPLLTIKDGWIEQEGPNRRTITATESVVEELPEEYLAYIDWLVDYETPPASAE